MGFVQNLLTDLSQDVLDGDEIARQRLLEWDAPQALWGINEKFDRIAQYLEHGLSIVPQLPGTKNPCVRWKPYQTFRPTVLNILAWFRMWPTAGPAVVLGPVSNLFAIDVDGKEAHRELVRRLGEVPLAPTVKSGSGKPFRYHLFFQHPAIITKAKATPWHSKLEFRGHGGIVIAPPAMHKSGNHYEWESGKSLNDIPLPPLPEAILAALQTRNTPRKKVATRQLVGCAPRHRSKVVLIPGMTRKTRAFLQGRFAEQPGWNERLFRAACDLAGNGVAFEKALPLLLRAAAPWNADEEARATATVGSAYSSPRVPAQTYAAQRRLGN